MATLNEMEARIERRKKSRRVFLGTLGVAGLGLAAWHVPKWLGEEPSSNLKSKNQVTSPVPSTPQEDYEALLSFLSRQTPVEESYSLFDHEIPGQFYVITRRNEVVERVLTAGDGLSFNNTAFCYLPRTQEFLENFTKKILIPETLSWYAFREGGLDFSSINLETVVHDVLLHEAGHILLNRTYGPREERMQHQDVRLFEEYFCYAAMIAEGLLPRYNFISVLHNAMSGQRHCMLLYQNMSALAGSHLGPKGAWPSDHELRVLSRKAIEIDYGEIVHS
jgi:hypothetical protein